MKVIPVISKRDRREFIVFPSQLYQDEENWIRPLDKDIEGVFDPAQNRSFKTGSCERWLLESEGKTIGRIAAFVSGSVSRDKSETELNGGIGFFECINDQKAANALFDTAKRWLANKGVTHMDGPINFGRRDRWWGLLTKGFELEPNYQCNYNFDYYQQLFETYGFQLYFDQYTFVKRIKDPLHPRLHYKADKIAQDSAYSFRHFNSAKFDEFASDIIEVYNKAWVNHEGVYEISKERGKAIIKRLKPIIDEKIIWVAYYHEEPVAIFVTIPEVNQYLKYLNGKLDFFGKLKFYWYKRTLVNRKILGMIFGVVPEHQGKGLDGGIIIALNKMLHSQKKNYEIIEMHGIGDFNKKMILVAKQVGGDILKVHTTYRYLFDRSQPFERMKSMGT